MSQSDERPSEERVVPVWAYTDEGHWMAAAEGAPTSGEESGDRPAVLVLCREGESREELAERMGLMLTPETANVCAAVANWFENSLNRQGPRPTWDFPEWEMRSRENVVRTLRALAALRTPEEPTND